MRISFYADYAGQFIGRTISVAFKETPRLSGLTAFCQTVTERLWFTNTFNSTRKSVVIDVANGLFHSFSQRDPGGSLVEFGSSYLVPRGILDALKTHKIGNLTLKHDISGYLAASLVRMAIRDLALNGKTDRTINYWQAGSFQITSKDGDIEIVFGQTRKPE